MKVRNIILSFKVFTVLKILSVLIFFPHVFVLNNVKGQALFYEDKAQPSGWFPLGASIINHYQQCFGYGDFDGDGNNEMLGSYSHSAVGMFIHRYVNNNWEMSVLHPKFDPDTLLHIKGMNGTWPVKGFTSGDFDGDGRYEIITYADQIMYPPSNGDTVFPFPGCIYIDYIPDSGKFIANPLFWGKWGENDASKIVSVLRATPVNADFRDTVHALGINDFIVNTLWNDSSKFKGRLYVLEQPQNTFNSVDYRYIHPGIIDTGNLFIHEPFYLQHLYVNSGGLDTEIEFNPSDYPLSSSAWCTANIWDYDHDGLIDMVVNISYQKGDTPIYAGVRVYHRLSSFQGKRYRFEEVFRKDIPAVNFWELVPADLNGNELDGQEGWVMNARIWGGASLFGVCGLATLQYVADTFQVLGTYAFNPGQMAMEYKSTYSSAAVLDADGDGYDDAAVVMLKPDHHGDIILFRNLNGQIRTFPELFCADNGNSQILWAEHYFTWDLHTGDFDDDGQIELGTAESLKHPPDTYSYQIYYSDAFWTAGTPDMPENKIALTAFPNPTNGTFTVNFYMAEYGNVRIDIFDINGKIIKQIVNDNFKAGNNTIKCVLTDLSSGIYYCRLINNKYSETLKIVLLKNNT